MTRFLAAVVGVLVGTAVGRADLRPPGTRNVPVDHVIETDKEYPDWVFLVVHRTGATRANLDPKTPITIPGSDAVGAGPVRRPGDKEAPFGLGYRSRLLAAVPKDTAKGYATDKELFAAVADGKAAGLVRAKEVFGDHLNVKADDPRKTITRRFKVAKVDPKDGIVLEAVAGEPGKEEEEEAAARPGYRWVAAGLGAAGLVGLAGLWLARSSRRT